MDEVKSFCLLFNNLMMDVFGCDYTTRFTNVHSRRGVLVINAGLKLRTKGTGGELSSFMSNLTSLLCAKHFTNDVGYKNYLGC
jgi:hypothetical protein